MSIYRPKGSRVWVMDFMFHSQRIRESTGMTSKTRAKEVHEKRKQSLKDGTAGIKKQVQPLLFSAAAEKLQEAMGETKWSPSMADIARNSLAHLLPHFGRLLLVDIDAGDIHAYQKQRKVEGASNRSVNIETTLLRQVMKWHGQWERIRTSPEWKLKGMLKERDDAGHALTASEEAILLRECGRSASRSLLPFVTLLLETGARYNTIRTLTWGQVDLTSRRITIGKDKTEAGTGRVVPLSMRAVATLELWKDQFPDRKPAHFVFPSELYGLFGAEGTFGGEVRVRESNPATAVTDIKKAWTSARSRTRRVCPECQTGTLADHEKPKAGFYCVDCGFECDELPEGLTKLRLHDLRHSAVSRMVAARVPLPTIAKIVGWSKSTTVAMAARYAHPAEDEMRHAVEAISGNQAEYPQFPPQSTIEIKATIN